MINKNQKIFDNKANISFLFYTTNINGTIAVFDAEESQHCLKVLRYKNGDIVSFTNGKGFLYKGIIKHDKPEKCEVEIIEIEKRFIQDAKLTIAISPPKNPSRYECFLEKAVEIGIHNIQPIICERTLKSNYKKERIEKIILSAMKQSLNVFLPELNDVVRFKDFCKNNYQQKFIAFYNENNLQLISAIKPKLNTVILIGPEGDFAPDEVNLAINNGFIPINLGNSRLRTETAALNACVIFNSINL